ncbi:MAG: Fur family transcriptional regulator [Bacteroidales bacterium]
MELAKILENHRLNKTSSRKDILRVFLTNHVALSEKEIQLELKNKYDRATVYRTLNTFSETGIIHLVSNESGYSRYLLRKQPEEHLHFRCNLCDTITCLTEIEIPDYHLPEGFTKTGANFLITGICNKCN